MTLAAGIAVGLIAAIAIFQVGLAAGAPWGAAAWGGSRPGVLPKGFRIASMFSIVILALLGWIVLARDGVVEAPVSTGVVEIAAWVAAGYFLLGTLANAFSRSRPERMWAPVAFVTAVCVAIVAAS